MMVKGINRFFQGEKLSKHARQQFFDEITEINLSRANTVGRFMILLFCLLLLLDYHQYRNGLWQETFSYQLMFLAHISALFFMCLFKMYLFYRNRVNAKLTTTHNHNLLLITANLFLMHISLISFCDVLISGSAVAYLGAIFALAAFSILLPVTGLAILSFNFFFMIILLIIASKYTGALLTIQMINITIYSIFSFILSRMLFRYQQKDFINRQKLDRQTEILEKLAMQDPLTEIMNRRHFLTIIEKEITRSERYKHALSLTIFDIDYFKNINDSHGHIIGDKVLKSLCQLINGTIRSNDVFARWGGEEFVILSLDIDKKSMMKMCEKLRMLIENHSTKDLPVITASFGVSEYISGDNSEELIHRADVALYKAKESGRNCIRV